MPASSPSEVRIRLARLDHLFQTPDPDPFSGYPHPDSGVDRILNAVRPMPRGGISATIVLPASERAADLEARAHAALQEYCDVRITHTTSNKASLRQEGLSTLWRGLVFLALCLLGSRLVGEPRFLPGIFGRFLDEGFIIAGWVALWYPLDVLLYQHWPLTREITLYQRLRAAELKFEFAG